MSEPTATPAPPDAGAEDSYSLQAKITQQQSLIRGLKKQTPPPSSEVILVEVKTLNDLRAQLAALSADTVDKTPAINKKGFDELMLRKMYIVPAFEIHSGPAGLFDFGPPLTALKSNMLALWRRHFVLEEGMLEVDCTNLTPHSVLETSGHVERFTDFMVRDEKSGECFRADKLLEDAIDTFCEKNPNMPIQEQDEHRIIQRQADAFSAEELHDMLVKYNVKPPSNPDTSFSKPFPFNLMFKTTIGPEGNSVGYLRPETAQGMFMNFKRLLEYNQGKMPFAAAQIGIGFRNEISPRGGLIRVREFCLAEIEHFVHPEQKSQPKLKRHLDKELILFPSEAQLSTGRTVKMAIGKAVEDKLVDNEQLGYFMVRTQLYLEKVGVDPARMRFRQHLRTEMAHYAADCWDMEIHMSQGWVECVGHADRACYDLEVHAKKTGVPQVASERLAVPIQVEREVAEPNRKLIGPRFKGDQKIVQQLMEEMDDEAVLKMKAEIEGSGKAIIGDKFEITADLVTFKSESKLVVERKFTPSVIEPAFGIGRILYAILEHSYSTRNGDEARSCMSFKPNVAPIKVGLFRLVSNPTFDIIIAKLNEELQANNFATRVDSSSGTVGRRYARADELGIPFGITVDFETPLTKSVTVRERDSMAQIRVDLNELVPLLKQLVGETRTWPEVMTRYRVISTAEQAAESEGEGKGKKVEQTKAAPKTEVQATTRCAFSRPASKA